MHASNNTTSGEPSSGSSAHQTLDPTRVRDAYVGAVSSVRGLWNETNDYLQIHARRSPYAVLGVAAGVGFVLGGGLASRLARLLLATGGRVLVLEVLSAPLDGELTEDTEVAPMVGADNDN